MGAGVCVGGANVWVGEAGIGVGGRGVAVGIDAAGSGDSVGRVQIRNKKTINRMIATINLKRL